VSHHSTPNRARKAVWLFTVHSFSEGLLEGVQGKYLCRCNQGGNRRELIREQEHSEGGRKFTSNALRHSRHSSSDGGEWGRGGCLRHLIWQMEEDT
jgi:hypothetical protein